MGSIVDGITSSIGNVVSGVNGFIDSHNPEKKLSDGVTVDHGIFQNITTDSKNGQDVITNNGLFSDPLSKLLGDNYSKITVTGTPKADNISVNSYDAEVFGNGGNDTLGIKGNFGIVHETGKEKVNLDGIYNTVVADNHVSSDPNNSKEFGATISNVTAGDLSGLNTTDAAKKDIQNYVTNNVKATKDQADSNRIVLASKS
jgi:hypothetical protein